MGNRWFDLPRVWVIICILTLVFTIGGNWFLMAYVGRDNSVEISEIKLCQEDLKQEVNTIKTKNITRDKNDEEVKCFMVKFHEWQIKDAEWKGMQSEINKSNLYYGGLDKVQEFMNLSEENKKAVSKKN